MKTPRKIDQRITQVKDTRLLLGRLLTTLHVTHTEAKLAFQRQLEAYEILSHRIHQIIESLPTQAVVIPEPKSRRRRKGAPLDISVEPFPEEWDRDVAKLGSAIRKGRVQLPRGNPPRKLPAPDSTHEP